jgi:hypothetical protein
VDLPALHVRIRIPDTDIDLNAAHFTSKLLTFPNGRYNPLDGTVKLASCLVAAKIGGCDRRSIG